jgi:phospholipid/cholesterol/gamma-HCH transport system substrate-binding protein
MIVAAVVAVYVAFTSPQGLPFATHSYSKAAFDDASGIRSGDDVRIAQVRVGHVQNIALQGGHAVLTMQFDQPHVVYHDAKATINGRSALGQEYVNLEPGRAQSGQLGASEVLPSSQTKGSTQVLDLIQQLDQPTRDATASSVRELGGGLKGHGRDLHDFASNAPDEIPKLGTVAQSLATNNGADLTRMLGSLDRVTSRFHGRQDDIRHLVTQTATTLDAVNADRGANLRRTLDKAPSSIRQLRGALSDAQRPLKTTSSAMGQLNTGARALGQSTPDLRGILREAPAPLGKLPGVSQDAQPALGDLTRVVADARPVAPKVPPTVESAATPLNVMAPYAPEIAKWFSYATYALNDGDAAGHSLRFTAIPAPDAATGNVPLRDPTTNSDPYPAPGAAPRERAPEVLSSLTGGGGK